MVLIVGTHFLIVITHDPLTLTRYNLDGVSGSVSLTLPPVISSNSGLSRSDDADDAGEDSDDRNGENTTKSNSESVKSDENITAKRRIVSGGLSPSEKILVLADDFKQLLVYEVNSWILLGARKVERKCDHIIFNHTEDKFIVSNRSGWIYGYDVSDFTEPKETPTMETFLLGHNAIILDVKLSPGSKYIATCDRDEKIRISNFPNCYNIESYCLGHTQFVSSLAFINDSILVSGSGDGTLRVWEYIKGKELSSYNFADDLELDEPDDKVAPMEIHVQTFDSIGKVIFVTFYNSPTFIVYKFDETTESLVKLIKTKEVANLIGSVHNNWCGFICFIDKPITITAFDISMHSGDCTLLYINNKLTDALLANTKFVEEYKAERSQLTNINWLWKNSFNNFNEYLEKKKERQEIHAMKKLKST